MLSIYRFRRKTLLVGTMICASLTVAMTAQSAHAQEIPAVRRAVVSNNKGSKLFRIDSSGRMKADGDSILEITSLDDSGSLVGKYYPSGKSAPAATNVTGSINLVRGAGASVTFGNAIRISFTVTQTTSLSPGASIVVNEMVFEGAIRLDARDPSFGFMAGTFTGNSPGLRTQGPFPFCAMLSFAVPG